MGAAIFIAVSAFALFLGPLLGILLLLFKATRKSAALFLLLPTAAAGGAIFGFWLLLHLSNGQVSPQPAMERSFYVGYVPFYVLGLMLALAALLFRPHGRLGAWLKGVG